MKEENGNATMKRRKSTYKCTMCGESISSDESPSILYKNKKYCPTCYNSDAMKDMINEDNLPTFKCGVCKRNFKIIEGIQPILDFKERRYCQECYNNEELQEKLKKELEEKEELDKKRAEKEKAKEEAKAKAATEEKAPRKPRQARSAESQLVFDVQDFLYELCGAKRTELARMYRQINSITNKDNGYETDLKEVLEVLKFAFKIADNPVIYYPEISLYNVFTGYRPAYENHKSVIDKIDETVKFEDILEVYNRETVVKTIDIKEKKSEHRSNIDLQKDLKYGKRVELDDISFDF